MITLGDIKNVFQRGAFEEFEKQGEGIYQIFNLRVIYLTAQSSLEQPAAGYFIKL